MCSCKSEKDKVVLSFNRRWSRLIWSKSSYLLRTWFWTGLHTPTKHLQCTSYIVPVPQNIISFGDNLRWTNLSFLSFINFTYEKKKLKKNKNNQEQWLYTAIKLLWSYLWSTWRNLRVNYISEGATQRTKYLDALRKLNKKLLCKHVILFYYDLHVDY